MSLPTAGRGIAQVTSAAGGARTPARQAQRGAGVQYLIAPGGEDDPIREVQLDVYGSVFLISEIQVRGNAPAAE